MTIALTLKTLTTLDVLRRFTYHIFSLGVSSGVSVWAKLLFGFRNDATLWRKLEGDFYILS